MSPPETVRLQLRPGQEMRVTAPGCQIVVRSELRDDDERTMTEIGVVADGDCFTGHWWVDGEPGDGFHNVRVVRVDQDGEGEEGEAPARA